MSQKTEFKNDISIVERRSDENKKLIQEPDVILNKMEDFCRTKRNMFMHIRDGLEEAQKVVSKVKGAMIYAKWHLSFLSQGVRWTVGKKLKEAKSRHASKKT